MPEMRKTSIPEGDPIRTLLPDLQPLGPDQVGEWMDDKINYVLCQIWLPCYCSLFSCCPSCCGEERASSGGSGAGE